MIPAVLKAAALHLYRGAVGQPTGRRLVARREATLPRDTTWPSIALSFSPDARRLVSVRMTGGGV
jgi:hypothetical protein